mmetsp:Transcript_52716/g.83659  ORF Transcript_52716/g.83659 Transcript_52716/m.83659 type:complete len:198 (+) Transcript_52716:59-652(+)|eukprot:CAMPEP_0169117218 /NCGR_PEP_ID=MMETSP1015-20121227/30338_1 /TAXON_ID=342587 /ORGANISM="Karlodinium micrum, Strain CCMP2283" /LENGTH=197 /DNA_ID=CAMNT_0009179881 /DNA_START=59 /DNA_END=652 /DNA_ORIENTATION=+
MKHNSVLVFTLNTLFVQSALVTRHENTDDEKSSCDITDFFLRGEEGFPIQMEKKGKTEYEATMCEGVPGFRTTVRLNEPVFTTGITCSISGVPGGLEKVEHGATKVVDFSVVEHPGPKANATETTTKYKLSVKRLSVAADQEACKVTMTRSAIQDCGYAPMLEKKRQEAAIIKGMKPPPTPPPTKVFFLQRLRGKGK